MLIKVDYREIKLLELLKFYTTEGIQIQSENLPIGDIIICNDAGQEKAIIERKSLADLAASIRDGRYNEQSYRLSHCDLHNHQIYYLIEGDLRYYKPFKSMPDKKSLLSAMISITFFKGFSLYRSVNLDESVEWIIQFAKKLEKEGPNASPYYAQASAAAQAAQSSAAAQASAASAAAQASAAAAEPAIPDAYASVMAKRVKKDNITPENIGEIMLSQIPGVSNISAATLMQKFGTFAKLLNALQNDANSLNDIKITNNNGQMKKLTKPCINNIYQYLVKPTVITVQTS